MDQTGYANAHFTDGLDLDGPATPQPVHPHAAPVAPTIGAAGPPSTGTHELGELRLDANDVLWVCTVAGTPGTWIDASASGREVAYSPVSSAITGTSSAALVDVPNIAAIVVPTVLSRPVYMHAYFPKVFNDTAGDGVFLSITDAANNEYERGEWISTVANQIGAVRLWVRLPAGTGGTFKMRWARKTGGTANIAYLARPAASAVVPFLRAVTA